MRKIKGRAFFRYIPRGLHSFNSELVAHMKALNVFKGIGERRLMLAASAVIWSACTVLHQDGYAGMNMYNNTYIPLSYHMAGDVAYRIRLGGIPYKNKDGKVIISGIKSEKDYLLPEGSIELQRAYDAARGIEPMVTLDMIEISDRLDTYLEGLEYSIKTASSFQGKVARHRQAGKSEAQAIAAIKDIIRYTQIVPHGQMAELTKETIALLLAKGYKLEELDNKYLNNTGRYKAIHLNFSKNGNRYFELQIHSQETLKANKDTRALYEEWRNTATEAERKEALYLEIKNIYDKIPNPPGIEAIKNYNCA